MSAVIGIDPGLTGALALYGQAELHAVEDMPTLRIGTKTVIDHYGLARIIDAWVEEWPHRGPVVWIEHVSSSPQQGVTSAFTFGRGYGTILGVCAAHFLTINFVTPPVWKASMKARGEKDEARARAKALFPGQSDLFARVKDHGRADAALIALYGAQHSPTLAA